MFSFNFENVFANLYPTTSADYVAGRILQNVILKDVQNSQGNICVGVSF